MKRISISVFPGGSEGDLQKTLTFVGPESEDNFFQQEMVTDRLLKERRVWKKQHKLTFLLKACHDFCESIMVLASEIMTSIDSSMDLVVLDETF